MSAITTMTDLMGEVVTLRQQLAETMAHLEAQRQATYQAVEREHAAKKRIQVVEGALRYLVTQHSTHRAASASHAGTLS
jgi:hypothetical protein